MASASTGPRRRGAASSFGAPRTARPGIRPCAVVDHVNTAIPFEDKPWPARRSRRGLAASRQRLCRLDALRRVWQRGSRAPQPHHDSPARATADGRSSRRSEISDDTGDAKDSDGTVEGAVPAVGPNGEVYVAWAGPKGSVFDRSDDGGWTFGKDHRDYCAAGRMGYRRSRARASQRHAGDRSGPQHGPESRDAVRQLDRRAQWRPGRLRPRVA